MPRKAKARKKFPRLPSGFGTIRYLGEGRRNPYAVNPPSTVDCLGHVVRPAALCYVDDWYKGFAVLMAYKAGTYKPGMEKDLDNGSSGDVEQLVSRILADYNMVKGVEEKHPEIHDPTFAEVYEGFWQWKFESAKGQSLSAQLRNSYRAAFKNCVPLHNRVFSQIKSPELQEHLDSVKLKHSSLELIVMLYKQMYKYAIMSDICTDDKSRYVSIGVPDDDEHGVPFSDSEIRALWEHRDDDTAQMILVMIYSGYRISAFMSLTVNLQEWFFQGGVKTAASRNRIVPIHSCIREIVEHRIRAYGKILPMTVQSFRKRMVSFLSQIGLPAHTPHDCRHTFSRLCEQYGVNENDRKRLMGHSFGADITNGIYGHRSLSDLRFEIEKIQVPCL